jgi:DNA-binding beta-propeller fold protein YncE
MSRRNRSSVGIVSTLLLAVGLTSCKGVVGINTFTLRLQVSTDLVNGYAPAPSSYTAWVEDFSGARIEKAVAADGSVDFPELSTANTFRYGVTDLPVGCEMRDVDSINGPSLNVALAERSVLVYCTGSPYTRSLFVQVDDPVEIRFNEAGDMFVANSGISQGNAPEGPIRRVTPAGAVAVFGDSVADPDALIVDLTGSVATVAGAVLVGGSFDFVNDSSRIWEIAPDGSTTDVLIEGSGADLTNPSSFAFLPGGELLISNFGSNSLSRLSRDTGGTLLLEPFYQDASAADGMISVEVLDGTVYAVTGSAKLAEVDGTGTEVTADLWASRFGGDPAKIAVGTSGAFDGWLFVATTEGRLYALDTATDTWTAVGTFTFDNPVFGMAVSPVDGALYVAESVTGNIWKVEPTP